jgi:hypothetical protein
MTIMEMNIMNISPFISRNTSWNSALNLLLPIDMVWQREIMTTGGFSLRRR